MVTLERVQKKFNNQCNLRSWSARQKERGNNLVTNGCSHRVCGDDHLPFLPLPVLKEVVKDDTPFGKDALT